jgi:hypothetical protein
VSSPAFFYQFFVWVEHFNNCIYICGINNYPHMKKFRFLLVAVLLAAFILPTINACKKGDGDPYFSLYTRKARLTNDWKVSSLTQTVKFNRTTITTTFDGTQKSVETFVPDTTVYTATDTLYEYRAFKSYKGSLLYSFDKSAAYQIDEAFTDDTTGIKFTSQETGLWYFTGGGRDSDTKAKELLGMQTTKFVYNPLNPDTYTLTYSGEANMRVYHIYELASKEIVLKYNTAETVNLWTVTTAMEMTLKPR